MFKFLLTLLFLVIESQSSVDFIKKCYKYDGSEYKQAGRLQSENGIDNIDVMIDKMLLSLSGSVKDRECDKVIFARKDKEIITKTKNETLYNKVKANKNIGGSDFVTLSGNEDGYLYGLSSKNFGIANAYYFYKSVDKINGIKYQTYVLEAVNFKKHYIDQISKYCMVNKQPPTIMLNQSMFTNYLTYINLKEGSINDPKINAKYNELLTSDDKDLYMNSGLLIPDKDICDNGRAIADYVKGLTSHTITGNKYDNGWSDIGDDDLLFEDNGFFIKYPAITYNTVNQLHSSFFTDYMNEHNIYRGIMITDNEPVMTNEHHEKKYKWKPWKTRDIVDRKIDITSTSYDISLNSITMPFNEYSASLVWDYVDDTFVSSINQFPNRSYQKISYTPSNHTITHSLIKGSDLEDSNLGTWHYEGKVDKKRKFNWTALALTIIAVVVFTVITAGTGAAAAGSAFSIAGVSAGVGSSGLMLGVAGIGGSTLAWAGVGVAVTQGAILGTLIGAGDPLISKEDLIKNIHKITVESQKEISHSGSSLLNNIGSTLTTLKNQDRQTFITNATYSKVLAKGLPDIDPSTFDKDYGSFMNYYLQSTAKIKIGQFYDSTKVKELYDHYKTNMSINQLDRVEGSDIMRAKEGLKTIMKKEWISF
jgi:hypothetical protein